MRWMKRFGILIGAGLLILAVVAIFFSNAIFRRILRGQLDGLQDSMGVQATFRDASFSWGGSASIDDLDVVDLEKKVKLASVERIDTEFGWSGVLSDPMVIDRLEFDKPILTLYPGIQNRFAARQPHSPIQTEQAVDAPTDDKEGTRSAFHLRKGELKKGRLRYRATDSDEAVDLVAMEATVQNLSDDREFEFDLSAKASGESEGTISLKGKVNPNTLDADINLSVSDLSYPIEGGKLPVTNGTVSILLEKELSNILSTGVFKMAAPPPQIPAELVVGNDFELNWKVEASVPKEENGPIQVSPSTIAIKGFKGGPQEIKGEGQYDPSTGNGRFTLASAGVSVPLLNPVVEPAAAMRVLSGKADLNFDVNRSGLESPFEVKGTLGVTNLAVKGLEDTQDHLKFQSIGLDIDGQYAPDPDSLVLNQLDLKVDDIPLSVRGKIMGAADETKRELDLSIQGDNLDVGRLITLFSPSMMETGQISGRTDIDLKVAGKTASDRFPVLNGNLNLRQVTLVPKENPEMKVGVKGDVQFDSAMLTAQSLDVDLGGTPGRVSLIVQGYNEPQKKIQADIRGVAIEPVVNLYKPSVSGLLIGNLDAKADIVMGRSSRPEELEINFTIRDGVLLTRHPIPSAIVNLIGWEWLRNGYQLTDARGKIVQDERGYRLNPVILMGEKGGLAISGWVGFDNKLTATARVNVAKSAINEVPGAVRQVLRARDDSEYAYLDIPFKGTVERPIPTLDLGNVVGTGIDVLQDKVQEKWGDEIRERTGVDSERVIEDAGNLLRGIFDRGE